MAATYELLILSADVGTRSLPDVPRAAITISYLFYPYRPFIFKPFLYDGRIISWCRLVPMGPQTVWFGVHLNAELLETGKLGNGFS